MKLAIVAHWGAGNLGDDLIGACLTAAIQSTLPEAEIELTFKGSSTQLVDLVVESGVVPRRGNPASESHPEVVLLGGGGLFQDTHHPLRPHHWLRYVSPALRRGIPVSAVGLGVGPLRLRFNRYLLARRLQYFRAVQVRDSESLQLLRSLNVHGTLAPDIVAGSAIDRYGFVRMRRPDEWLGCSLREWPGLRVADCVEALAERVSEGGHLGVRLFAFEHRPGVYSGEVELLDAVTEGLRYRGVRAEVFSYGSTPLDVFSDAMSHVSVGVAMRFHANVIWRATRTPVIPVSYAPKVQSLFGGPWVPLSADVLGRALRREPVLLDEPVANYQLPKLMADRVGPIPRLPAASALLESAFEVADASLRIGRRLSGRRRPPIRQLTE